MKTKAEREEVIAEYPNDVPLPSSLLLGFLGNRPIHIVVAFYDPTKDLSYCDLEPLNLEL